MNPHDISIQDHQIATSSALHRSKGTVNFSHILSRRRQDSRTSENRLSTNSRRSISIDSENSQILYMSSQTAKKRRETGRSLSSIGNSAERRDDDSEEVTLKENEPVEDAESRHIIDREIWEWQYVCQSGRPYWWSPEAKYSRLQRLQRSMASEAEPETRMYTVKTGPQPHAGIRRQTVSDSYLAEPSTVHDLAHLIAVQLLGACFTLPPDAITAVTPEYTRNGDGISVLKDPQLISALRMHTHFRYSPSFGHQARNTSPVQLWPGRYDGPKSSSSPIASNTGSTTPNIGTSSPCYRRHKLQRPLHNTEGSEGRTDRNDYEYDTRTCCSDSLDPIVAACAWCERGGVQDWNKRSITHPHMPGASSRCTATHSPEPSGEEHRVSRPRLHAATTKYRLQPVIRSEPHHVFIQPVRELVVKRWRNFRRRLSGSLQSSLPAEGSDEVDSASESSASELSSPFLSSGAKERRLRAQERGDIHSSSADSTPHFNTPVSGHLSPNNNEFLHTTRNNSQNSTPAIRLADPLAAAASFVVAERTQETPGIPSPTGTPDSTSSRGWRRSMAWSAAGTCGTGQASFSSLPANSLINTPTSSYSFASQRTPGRSRRRSMLSEVCTPADLRVPASSGYESQYPPFDRNALSVLGSAIATPEEEIITSNPFGGRQIDNVWSSHPTILLMVGEAPASKVRKRPRMSRTSTSGTQVFTPNEDGVEVDGMPVGPARDLWMTKESRREHTYL